VKKFWIHFGISLAVGALFVWLAVRGVEWDKVLDAFSQVDPLMLLVYFFIALAIEGVRIIRWGILLKPLGHVPLGRLFTAGAVGFMALMLLPLRLGEFARPILVAERGKIRISAALATVVVERVIDALAMASLLVALLFFLQDRILVPVQLRTWAYVILLFFVLLLVFLVLAYRRQETTVSWFKRLVKPVSSRVADRLASILHSFIDGLKALPNARLLAGFLLLTVVYWFIAGAGMVYMFGAFDELRLLGWVEGFTALAVLCVGLMIPAGPGMIGNFHYFIKLGLSLFLAEAALGSAGLAYAVVVHAMQLGQQVLVGIVFLFTGHVSFKRILSAPGVVGNGLGGGADRQGD
jgi:uncharacterized protein (TIRG00374 family)